MYSTVFLSTISNQMHKYISHTCPRNVNNICLAFFISDEPYYVTGYPAAGGGGGLVGYDDYDYGDYNEGVGLLPPRPLTVTERVFKWFDGFKPPSLKVTMKESQIYCTGRKKNKNC